MDHPTTTGGIVWLVMAIAGLTLQAALAVPLARQCLRWLRSDRASGREASRAVAVMAVGVGGLQAVLFAWLLVWLGRAGWHQVLPTVPLGALCFGAVIGAFLEPAPGFERWDAPRWRGSLLGFGLLLCWLSWSGNPGDLIAPFGPMQPWGFAIAGVAFVCHNIFMRAYAAIDDDWRTTVGYSLSLGIYTGLFGTMFGVLGLGTVVAREWEFMGMAMGFGFCGIATLQLLPGARALAARRAGGAFARTAHWLILAAGVVVVGLNLGAAVSVLPWDRHTYLWLTVILVGVAFLLYAISWAAQTAMRKGKDRTGDGASQMSQTLRE